jgi:hypothetical protein
MMCGTALAEAPREGAEERKVVSVLFEDLVGFTARSHDLVPEDVRAAFQPYHKLLKRNRARVVRSAVRLRRLPELLVVGAVLLANACGDGSQVRSHDARSSSRRYVTNNFEPRLSLEIGRRWGVSMEQKPYLEVSRGPDEGSDFMAVSFNSSPPKVSHPRHPESLVRAPEDWVSWFQRHPYLRVSRIERTKVGGLRGTQFVTKVSSPKDYYSEDCEGEGVALWPLLRGHHWCADEGFPSKTIVMDDVTGHTVIVDVWSRSQTFKRALVEADHILKTVEWER